MQLTEEMKKMRGEGWSYAKIAMTLGVTETEMCENCGKKLTKETGFLCVDCITTAKGK